MYDLITWLIFIFLAIITPSFLTVTNVICCFKDRPKLEKASATVTVLVGGLLYLALTGLLFSPSGDYYESLYAFEHHYFISSEYRLTLLVPFFPGAASYFWLLYAKEERKPPLLESSAVAFILILNVINIAIAVQISKNVPNELPLSILLYVYHINIFLLSFRVIHRRLKVYLKYYSGRENEMDQHARVSTLYKTLSGLCRCAFPVMAALFAIICILEILFLIAGQGLDAPVKAFTDTADWTFSKQIPPPPQEYDGHYLCTVAAGGHRKIVKPQRLGRRLGAVIVVNRQLSIANAFEEAIHDKHPLFHKHIRHFYDTHGYPVSKYINTKTKADMVYLLMKPLEWSFLLYLYFADADPEKRIGRQYQL